MKDKGETATEEEREPRDEERAHEERCEPNEEECEPNDEAVNYAVKVHWVIMAGEDAFFATSKDFSRFYSWDHETEIGLEPISGTITGSTRTEYPKAVLGFKKLPFDLENTEDRFTILRDEGHWHHSWYMNVIPQSYTPTTGKMDLNVNLLFKQWADPVPLFSYKNKGNAFLQAQVVLIQLKDAERSNLNHSGSFAWDPKDEPCSSAGKAEHAVSFDF